MKSLITLTATLFFAGASFAAEINIGFRNQHTSIDIDRKECFPPPKQIAAYNSGDEVVECPAPKGWHLYVVIGGENAWIDIAHGRSIWSTRNTILSYPQSRFGNFPSLGDRVEWRMTKSGEPKALVFRIIAQDPEADGPNLTRLFVISLTKNSAAFCGMFETNQKAKEIADTAINCKSLLSMKTLPKQ